MVEKCCHSFCCKRSAWLLIHRASNLWRGTTSEFEHALDSSENMQRNVLELLASRSKFTPEKILERCRTHDWWISASDALKFGFIDQVR